MIYRKARVLGFVFLLLALTGCIPLTFSWYQPAGSGEATQSGCGMPADVMRFHLDEKGSRLEVWIDHPKGRDPVYPENYSRLQYHIYLAPGSRVKVLDPTFSITGNSGNKLYEYKPKTISGSHGEYILREYSTRPISEELTSPSNDPIPKNASFPYRDSYSLLIDIESLPQEFQVNYPPLMINGNRKTDFSVKYAEREGTFFACRYLF